MQAQQRIKVPETAEVGKSECTAVVRVVVHETDRVETELVVLRDATNQPFATFPDPTMSVRSRRLGRRWACVRASAREMLAMTARPRPALSAPAVGCGAAIASRRKNTGHETTPQMSSSVGPP